MKQNEAIAILTDVIVNDKHHRDYERVVQMSEQLTKLVTGENMDSLMRRFDRREDKEQFNQRKRITQHITKTVCKNLMKPAYKIPRSNGIQRILMYTEDNENKKLKELSEDILDKFWGNRSMDDYLNQRWISLNYTDPNSFVVFEWENFDYTVQHAKPYPYEVSSAQAVYYEFDNNILQYLVVKTEFEQSVGDRVQQVEQQQAQEVPKIKNPLIKWTFYASDFTIVLMEVQDEQLSLKDGEWEQGADYVNLRGRDYRVFMPKPHNLGYVPAIRTGFELDIYTEGRTCVSPIDEAVPILMKIVKSNSELDLTMALHAFPQKIQYVGRCKNKCQSGKMPDGSTCPVCNGTGVNTIKSAQEIIELEFPRNAEDIVSLDNILKYYYPPVDLLRFQDEYVKNLTQYCKEAIYNSDIYSRKEIAETATGKNIDLQNVYDALYSMAQAYARNWEFFIKAISEITDMNENLYYKYIFSRDFKMKSLNDLYNDLKLVSDSKADSFVKQGIQDDIAKIMYADNQVQYQRYKTKETFYPYSGKTVEQIMYIITTAPVTDFHRTLWEMYGYIFNELEMEQAFAGKNFYDLERSKQWKLIEKKVNKEIKKRADRSQNTGLGEGVQEVAG